MKLKRFDPGAKKGKNSPKRELKGPVGRGDSQTKKSVTASKPTGSVGVFYEPDRSFTPDTTKKLPKKKANPSKVKKAIGRSASSTRMVKRGKPTINKGISS